MRSFFLFKLVYFILITNLYAHDKSIAFINMDLIFSQSLVGKSVNIQIQKVNEKNKIKFKQIENEIKAENEEINNQKNILSEVETSNKIQAFNLKIKNFQTQVKESNEKINRKRLEATGKILEQLKPILETFSKENSISLIMQKKNIIIGKNELDITDEIIKILDNKIKKIDVNL
tara:strand:- start:459 stop:983 length:525 start_codon:yes stop_codon:yes gene_type:complete